MQPASSQSSSAADSSSISSSSSNDAGGGGGFMTQFWTNFKYYPKSMHKKNQQEDDIIISIMKKPHHLEATTSVTSITFGPGWLGLKFGPSGDKEYHTCVREVSEFKDFKSPVQIHNSNSTTKVCNGMLITHLNNTDLKSKSLAQTVESIQSCSRPLVLTFKQPYGSINTSTSTAKGTLTSGQEQSVAVLLHEACAACKLPMVQYLLESNNIDTSLFLSSAAKGGDVEIYKLLTSNKKQQIPPPLSGPSPLHIAASFGHVELVKFILSTKNCTKNIVLSNTTPLHLAASHNHLQVILVLLSHYKSHQINFTAAANSKGQSALQVAVAARHVEVVKQLLPHFSVEDIKRLGSKHIVIKKLLKDASVPPDAPTGFCIIDNVARWDDFYNNPEVLELQVLTVKSKWIPLCSNIDGTSTSFAIIAHERKKYRMRAYYRDKGWSLFSKILVLNSSSPVISNLRITVEQLKRVTMQYGVLDYKESRVKSTSTADFYMDILPPPSDDSCMIKKNNIITIEIIQKNGKALKCVVKDFRATYHLSWYALRDCDNIIQADVLVSLRHSSEETVDVDTTPESCVDDRVRYDYQKNGTILYDDIGMPFNRSDFIKYRDASLYRFYQNNVLYCNGASPWDLGVPFSLRKKIYLQKVGTKFEKEPDNSLFTQKCRSAACKQIKLDVTRTFAHSLVCNTSSLLNVLESYATNTTIGYCQSMNVIAARVLQITENDEISGFKIFAHVIEKFKHYYDSPDLRGVRTDALVMIRLGRIRLSKVFYHLEHKLKAPLSLLFTKMLLTMFCTSFIPSHSVFRILDLIMLTDNSTDMILFGITLAILRGCSSQLLEAVDVADVNDILKEFQESSMFDIDAFLYRAQTEIRAFDEYQIRSLRKEVSHELFMELYHNRVDTIKNIFFPKKFSEKKVFCNKTEFCNLLVTESRNEVYDILMVYQTFCDSDTGLVNLQEFRCSLWLYSSSTTSSVKEKIQKCLEVYENDVGKTLRAIRNIFRIAILPTVITNEELDSVLETYSEEVVTAVMHFPHLYQALFLESS